MDEDCKEPISVTINGSNFLPNHFFAEIGLDEKFPASKDIKVPVEECPEIPNVPKPDHKEVEIRPLRRYGLRKDL